MHNTGTCWPEWACQYGHLPDIDDRRILENSLYPFKYLAKIKPLYWTVGQLGTIIKRNSVAYNSHYHPNTTPSIPRITRENTLGRPPVYPFRLAAFTAGRAIDRLSLAASWLGLAMIHLRNITICYRQHPAVHHISGTFAAGSRTAIIGPNGAGKTTLLKAMVGLLPVSTGEIDMRGSVGYLPQLTELDRQFPLTVAELALSGHWRERGNWRGLDKAATDCAADALERVGLSDFYNSPISNLSGGQLQRARFARLIVQNTPIILLDEPFNSVDSRSIETLVSVLDEWKTAGKTVVTVVHDYAMARAHFPQTLLLAREAIAWGDTADALNDANLARAQHIAEHWLSENAWCERP